MQTAEIIRSAVLCMENNSTDDPRCLAAAQELYNVVAGLGAKEIRSLTTTPEQEERRRFQQQQMELEQQQQSQFRSSSSVANTNNNNSRTGSAVKFADQVSVDNTKNHPSKTSLTSTKARSTTTRSSSAAHSTRSPSSTSTTTSTSHSTTTTTMTKDTDSLIQSLPPHLMGFVSEAPPPLHVRSLIHLAFKCYSGAAGFIHPSPTVEHVAQVTLVTLRLCVAADAIHETKDVQLLSELALQLGAGRTNSVPTPTPSSLASTLNTRTNQNHNSRSASSTTSGVSPASSSSQIPQISTVSVLAAIELFMVALYNNRISSIVTDCALSAAFRHWLSAWLVRIEDGSASQPIEIFHRLCCFQRLVTLRPTAAANVFAAQGFHERLIDFVCGDGAAVHASSIGLALHLLAQMVEDGPENLMMRFVTPKLIELHIASWSASEWTETLEGAFVLLTACVRLGLSLDLWKCIVHANLHLVCSHAIASPSVRVAAAAATCLRTMLFMCQRDLDIGLSVFFDTLASPNIFRVLDNHGGAKLMMSANNHHSNNKNEQQQQQQDVTGLRILTTECALIVAVFASFSPQHRVAAHHVSHKLHFPLSMQRALLTMNDADLSLFVNWTLFDEAGRSVSGVDDKQFNLLLKNRPLAPPPPGTTLQEWTDAAYVKFSLQKALQPPSQSDIASVFGFLTNNPDFPTNPKPPGLGSKDLSLALLKWFSTPLQVVAATEGKTSAQSVAALVPTKHHQQASSSLIQLRADNNNNNNESTTSSFDEDQFTKDHFESCVNLIIRFAKCSPVDNGTEEDREGWNSPIDSNKKRRKQQHPMSSSSSSMMIKMGNSNNNNNTKLHVDPMSLQRNRANAAGINSSSFMMMNQSAASSGTTSRMMNQSQHKKSVNTSMRHGASVSMASSTMNTSGVRRTHLFSHPYVDYYLNAQKKNAYTPIPAIPPQVRRWDLEDIQKRDLFSFLIRLDGLEHLIALSGRFANKVEKDVDGESQQDVSAMTSTNAASSPSSSRRRRTTTTAATPQSALEKLHRETPNDYEDEEDYDDDDFDEEYEEEVEEEVEEEIEESDDDEQDAKKPRYETHIRKIRRTIRTKSVASDDDEQEDQDENTKEANSGRKHVSQELFSQERNNKNTVDQSSSPSSSKRRRILHSSSSTRKRGQEQQGVIVDNYQNQNQAQEEEEQEREAHTQLQHRVTTLIADALHRAELHLLKMNEKTQCCPVKMLNRRAFLIDMVNNVMPAIISMLTMLFSVAKRAPAAVVRVARRVERSEAAAREGSYNYASMAGRRSPSQNLENQEQQHHSPAYHGSITINPANICAVCFQLEMEMAWY